MYLKLYQTFVIMKREKKYLCLNFYILAGPFKQAVFRYTATQLLLIFFSIYTHPVYLILKKPATRPLPSQKYFLKNFASF